MKNYRINDTDFAIFNSSGYIEYFYNWGTRYCYEIPCNHLSYIRTIYDVGPYSKTLSTRIISYKNCQALHTFLYRNADMFLQPRYNIYYTGPLGNFCFSHDYTFPYPYKYEEGPVPYPFSTYRIRPESFEKKTRHGIFFRSPTVFQYEQMVARHSPNVHTGYDDDYVYDFWDPENTIVEVDFVAKP